jgi:hypothetical protein
MGTVYRRKLDSLSVLPARDLLALRWWGGQVTDRPCRPSTFPLLNNLEARTPVTPPQFLDEDGRVWGGSHPRGNRPWGRGG